MILADKIIEERKKLRLSQEELAEKLSVSRQAVSKWEGAQSTPDLQKIIAMSELFSVSTDYLLKDEMEPENAVLPETDADTSVCRVSMEEANGFMEAMRSQSRTVALGVLLCILSPVPLIYLAGRADENPGDISEGIAAAVGITALFVLIAAAVVLFIRNASRTEKYDYLSREPFETAYGVSGLVKEKKAGYRPTFTLFLSLGIVLCTLSPLPLIISALVVSTDTAAVSMTALLLCVVAAGVYMIVRVSVVKTSYEILLQEGDYRKGAKQQSRVLSAVSGIYWCLAAAAYCIWSFTTNDWKTSWIVWPIAGVLCAPVMKIAGLCFAGKDTQK